jgi:hypothetical protein
MKLRPINPNCTEITVGEYTILFSYKTPVAYHLEGKGYFKTSKKWSKTTLKHINQWLDGSNAIEVSQDELDKLGESLG